MVAKRAGDVFHFSLGLNLAKIHMVAKLEYEYRAIEAES